MKFDETVSESLTARGECEEEPYYAVAGEATIEELVEEASKVQMKALKKHGVSEKGPREEHGEETGESPVGVKWVDTNKGDKEKPEYRCRLVAQETKKDKREEFVLRQRRR